MALTRIEYPKSHHTIPRSWIVEIRNIFVIPENMKATVANSITNWKSAEIDSFRLADISGDIPKENELPPLLFVLRMIL